jgi:hypothetical protein
MINFTRKRLLDLDLIMTERKTIGTRELTIFSLPTFEAVKSEKILKNSDCFDFMIIFLFPLEY